MHSRIHVIAAACLVALASSAQAQDGASMFSVSGFGTVGAVKTSTDMGAYQASVRPGGAKSDWNTDVDTKLAVQVTATFNPMFSATGQLMTRVNGEGNWNPAIQWLFAKAKFGKGFSARAGRIGAPFFMVSDFRDVGYTNVWVRPPVDVYGQVNFSTFDGADLLYQGDVGPASINAQVFGGKASVDFGGGVDVKLKNLLGFNASAEMGPVTVRVGHLKTKLTVLGSAGLNSLVGGLKQVGQTPGLGGLVTLANDMDVNGKNATFTGIGMALDWNNIVASAEFTKRRTDSYIADTTGWYTTVGYRVGKFTPYVTLSEIQQDSPTSSNAIPPLPQLAPLAAGLNGLLRSLGQSTTAVGVRWDAMKNVAVKGQYDRIKVDAGAAGLFNSALPGLGGTSVNVYSVVVDFVF
ncbi:hypothetical protein DES47_104208 [Roseateles toxinivorans]|uniref:Porin n=2 Tax=Roseateles toxinivorans TaxID=270368 RepID=A0A4R6QJM1_9BURK|nr:hypothetical protein DES47_104208 [Roseateles toxinivorans]